MRTGPNCTRGEGRATDPNTGQPKTRTIFPRFHVTHHTAATLLLKQCVHPRMVQELLGHSSIAVTMDMYSYVLPSMGAEAAAKMDALLAATQKSVGSDTVAKL